jgi:hypothetical protein
MREGLIMVKSVFWTFAVVAAVPLVATGCSSSGGKDDSANAAVTAAMDKWAAATTPDQACAAVSVAFAGFLGDGPASGCPAHIIATLGINGLEQGTVHVKKVTVTDGTAIVNANIVTSVPTYTNFYFVQESGTWKLNSIGNPAPAIPSGAPAPGAPSPSAASS